ncbi:MAG: glycosyltransferase, partial [bacterium]
VVKVQIRHRTGFFRRLLERSGDRRLHRQRSPLLKPAARFGDAWAALVCVEAAVPEVSVIIPTHNRATMVCEAIESVLNQTSEDLEIIVVDDGSEDHTGEVLRNRYAPERVRYFYQANRGRSAARNRGVAASRGRYVLFLDSDDLLLPQALEHEVGYLDSHPDVDVVYTDGYFCDEAGTDVSRIAPARPDHRADDILEDLVISNVILACHSAMVRRTALDGVGPPYFDEALRGTEDEDLWIRLAARGNTFAYLDVPTCKYRVHDSNASRCAPSSRAFLARQKSVKRSRFKILRADFFPSLRLDTRERFLYQLLLFQLEGDEPAREEVLSSDRFGELPVPAQGRLLYYLGVKNITAERSPLAGRHRLEEAVCLMPRDPKYKSILWLSYLNPPLLNSIIGVRRWLKRIGRKSIPPSPIGPGGLHLI